MSAPSRVVRLSYCGVRVQELTVISILTSKHYESNEHQLLRVLDG